MKISYIVKLLLGVSLLALVGCDSKAENGSKALSKKNKNECQVMLEEMLVYLDDTDFAFLKQQQSYPQITMSTKKGVSGHEGIYDFYRSYFMEASAKNDTDIYCKAGLGALYKFIAQHFWPPMKLPTKKLFYDLEDSKLALLPAAQAGYAPAQIFLALLNGKIINQENFSWLMKAANQKHPIALLKLAMAYANGHYVKADKNKAAECFEKAFLQGSYMATVMLPNVVYVQQGRSEKEAFEAIKKAAKSGNANAMMITAVGHMSGNPEIEQNNQKACKYFKEAVKMKALFPAKEIEVYYNENCK